MTDHTEGIDRMKAHCQKIHASCDAELESLSAIQSQLNIMNRYQNELIIVRKALVNRGISEKNIRDNYKTFYNLMCETGFSTDEKNVTYIYEKMNSF
jgi:hypothetical protein